MHKILGQVDILVSTNKLGRQLLQINLRVILSKHLQPRDVAMLLRRGLPSCWQTACLQAVGPSWLSPPRLARPRHLHAASLLVCLCHVSAALPEVSASNSESCKANDKDKCWSATILTAAMGALRRHCQPLPQWRLWRPRGFWAADWRPWQGTCSPVHGDQILNAVPPAVTMSLHKIGVALQKHGSRPFVCTAG